MHLNTLTFSDEGYNIDNIKYITRGSANEILGKKALVDMLMNLIGNDSSNPSRVTDESSWEEKETSSRKDSISTEEAGSSSNDAFESMDKSPLENSENEPLLDSKCRPIGYFRDFKKLGQIKPWPINYDLPNLCLDDDLLRNESLNGAHWKIIIDSIFYHLLKYFRIKPAKFVLNLIPFLLVRKFPNLKDTSPLGWVREEILNF